MELVPLPDNDTETLNALRSEEGVMSWAFCFLQPIPGVTMILSGMLNLEQVQDNIYTFEVENPLNEEELHAILKIAGNMTEQIDLPYTACRFCLSYCPQQIKISEAMADFTARLSS